MAMADNHTTSSSPLLPPHHHHHHYQAQEKPRYNSASKSRNLAEDKGAEGVKEAQPQNITIKEASCMAAAAEDGTAIDRLSHRIEAHGVPEDTGCRGQDIGSGGEHSGSGSGSGSGSIASFNSGVWLQSPAATRKRLSVFKEISPSKSLGDDHKDDQADSIIVYSQQDMQEWCQSVLPSSRKH